MHRPEKRRGKRDLEENVKGIDFLGLREGQMRLKSDVMYFYDVIIDRLAQYLISSHQEKMSTDAR